jgi:hypothetical protein
MRVSGNPAANMIGSAIMPETKDQKIDLPQIITDSLLWNRLATRQEYIDAIIQIRSSASLIAGLVSGVLPGYTDHSQRHMDSLWQVAGQVLTEAEIRLFNSGETLLLGASFYLHDLGMAIPVTTAGREQIKTTAQYRSAYTWFERLNPRDKSRAEELAIRETTRELHARKALELATQPLPGQGRFLIENSDFRDRWAHMLGQIAESHHWTLEQVERSLGNRNAVPGPDGETLDLAYIACVLRVVDFSHINRQRALSAERAVRSEIPPESAVHWDAQTDITGPTRDRDMLVFGCTKPLRNVDAWWFFYDLAGSLDAEIRSVGEYLRNRSISEDRFSLKGVKGIESPAVFNQYVSLPENVLPIDIRVQPGSMERVIDLLGGKHIYGRDRLAPIRELLQNARDATELRFVLERASGHETPPGEITVGLEKRQDKYLLKVKDNGVGMTSGTVRKYLLGVGADYWNSVDFTRDFSKAIENGFRPIGKFGIGFLSVFMLGDHIDVRTEARGGKRIHLTLHGVGRRGELREHAPSGYIGTEVEITLREPPDELPKHLAEIVRARAPMLSIPLNVKVDCGELSSTKRIEPGWWKKESEKGFFSFVRRWEPLAHRGGEVQENQTERFAASLPRDPEPKLKLGRWPGKKPEFVRDDERLVCVGGSGGYGLVVCSNGIAVQRLPMEGIIGLCEIGTAELPVSRGAIAALSGSSVVDPTEAAERLTERFTDDILPATITRVDELAAYGMLPGRIQFLRSLASSFGQSLLHQTSLKWIPVNVPPGDLIHHSREGFEDLVRRQHGILLAVGTSADFAYNIATPHIASDLVSELPLVAISAEEVDIDYDDESRLEAEGHGDTIQGPLDTLMSMSGSESDWEPILLQFLLECVARAWNLQPKDLRNQKWYLRYKENVVWAALASPKEIRAAK